MEGPVESKKRKQPEAKSKEHKSKDSETTEVGKSFSNVQRGNGKDKNTKTDHHGGKAAAGKRDDSKSKAKAKKPLEPEEREALNSHTNPPSM